ncbi:hypothetical protein J1N35_007768 [Gossypium stocksii]|uniref:Uncharacterized protein n=1 Tax=Gossypium stocksii TaxID=47602 RepID=A0A9D4AFV9_9ROSI|nr:hypothetical protein J1N35_007768 [Gossypium stocksii]
MKVVLEILGLQILDVETLIKRWGLVLIGSFGKPYGNSTLSLRFGCLLCVEHEILPTNVRIASIWGGFDHGCPKCGAEDKALIHALKDYPTS